MLVLVANAARADDVAFRSLVIGEPRADAAVAAPIYNGALTGAFPAVVAVGVFNDDGSAGLCSGTLITPTVVLTAGHCPSFAFRCGRRRLPDGD